MGNKTDLDSERQVSTEEGQQLANLSGVPYIETSAKNSTNIEQVFKTIATKIMHSVDRGTKKLAKEPVRLDSTEPIRQSRCC